MVTLRERIGCLDVFTISQLSKCMMSEVELQRVRERKRERSCGTASSVRREARC